MHSRIAGTGSYLPTRVVTNEDLALRLNTSDEWIRQRTGIVTRHIAAQAEEASDMAVIASQRALASAGIGPRDLDLIIVATISPDMVFPSTAALLQAKLGARNVGSFDVSAACSGFVYGLAIADSMIARAQVTTTLVVGAEKMSRLLDWDDRSTCTLFGDGAGAAILIADPQKGVRSVHLHAEGNNPELLNCARYGPRGHIKMDGGTVFKFAVRALVDSANEALTTNGFTALDVDWFVPHQANRRIVEAASRKVGVSLDKTITTVDRHANTSAASIPIALDEAVRDGRICRHNEVLVAAVGGGFTWASALIHW